MSDIERLENELRQSKQMLLNLSSRISGMEAELAEMKKLQNVSQNKTEENTKYNPTPATGQQPIVQPGQMSAQQPGQQQGQQPGQQQGRMPAYQTQQQPGQIQAHQTTQPQGQNPAQQPGQQSIYRGNPQPAMQYQQSMRAQNAVNNMQPMSSAQSSATEIPSYNSGKRIINTEAMLGKNIMGIAASVLIFISFILFAVLMVPLLTDSIKVVLMLTVSLGITAFGLIMWFRKERKSTFFLSLSACGVGAVYISLFMCNAYFHIINDIVLYLLILMWGAGVLVLSKYKQRLFEIIGESGILISIIFGCAMCVKESDGTMLMILTIYSIIGIAAFLTLRIKDEISLLIHGIFAMISIIALTVSDYNLQQNSAGGIYVSVSLIILAISCIAVMVLYLISTNDKNAGYLPIFSMAANALLLYCTYLLIDNKTIAWVVLLILAIGIYCGLECIKKIWEKRITAEIFPIMMEIWQILMLLVAFCSINNIDILKDKVGIAILAVPLIIYGYIIEDRYSQIKGLVTFGILVFSLGLDLTSYTILPLACFILISVFMMIKRNEYNVITKDISYSLFFLFFTICYIMYCIEYTWEENTSAVTYIWLAGMINLAAKITPYGKSWVTHENEKSFTIISNVINSLLMLFSLYAIVELNGDIAHFMAVLGAIGLFCINSIKLLKKDQPVASVYVGIKFTILVMFILTSYDAANYVLSISAFVLAIAFIVLGFLLNIKSLRIYGLVVSMICTLKLVMVDITYENTAGHALSFFISGVLCFVISAVYSKAEKKLLNKE